MNHTFRTLWNAVRGQLVPVCETASLHSQAGSEAKGGSVCAASSPLSLRRTAAAIAVAAAFAASAAQAAVTPPSGWEYGDNVITTGHGVIDFSGGWYGTYDGNVKNQSSYQFQEGSVLQGGVYGYDKFMGELTGDPSQTGIASMKRVWNAGTLRDTDQYDKDGDGELDTAQIGASWRIEEFYNASTGSFDGRELRIYTNLWNDGSAFFKADDLRLQSGANVHNTGTMNFGNVYAGLQNADVATLEGAQYAAGGTAKWVNEGTVNVTGTFTNHLTLEDQGGAASWSIAKWDNHANATLKTVKVTNGLANAAGAVVTIDALTLAGTSTNAGTLKTTTLSLANGFTNTGTANLGNVTLSAGSSIETSSVFTANAVTGTGALNITNGSADIESFEGVGTITNAGTQTDIASLTLTGASTLTNTGTLTGTTLSLAGTASNSGTLTYTGTATFAGTYTNTGTTTVGNVALTDGGKIATSKAFTANAVTGTGTLEITSGAADIESINAVATLTNTGTQTDIANLTLTGASSLTNTGTITGQTMSLAGTASNQGTMTYSGAASINGTFTNKGALSAVGTTIAKGGHLDLQEGSNASLGNVDVSGTLTIHTAQATLGEIAAQKGSVINNNQALNVALTASDGVTYNQTAGSLSLSSGSWFTNSKLNISGGALSRDTLGTGNDYVISGSNAGGFTDQTQVGSDWKDDQTVFTLGTLDSTSKVTLGSGGVLEVGTIALTDKTLTFDGGAISASLDQMFQGVMESAFNINTDEGESITTSVIGATSVAGLSDNFKNNIAFTGNGGTVVITDKAVTTGAVAGSSSALKVLAGSGASNVNVVYTGTITTSTDGGQSFYHNTFEQLKKEQQDASGGSAFLDPGLIFAGMTYANLDREGGTARDVLTVGASAEGDASYLLDQSIGFKAVSDATTVTVQDGKKFVLVGDAKSDISLVGEAGGTVNAKGSGTVFQLGTTGVTGAKGHLQSVNVSDSASFTAKAGTYTVANLSLAAGTTSSVQEGSNLTVTATTDAAGAKMTNAGVLIYTNAVDFKGDYVNSKTMTLASGGTVTGKFTNDKGATLESRGALTFASATSSNAGTIRHSGGDLAFTKNFTNTGGISATGNALKVSDGSVFANQGDVATASITVSGGQFGNTADALVYTDSLTVQAAGQLSMNGTILADEMKAEGVIRKGANATFITGAGAVDLAIERNEELKKRLAALGVNTDSSKRKAASAGVATLADADPTYALDDKATAKDVLEFEGDYGNTLTGVTWKDKQNAAISASSEAAADGNYSIGLAGATTFSDESTFLALGTLYVDYDLAMKKGTTFANEGWNDKENGRFATGRTVVSAKMTLEEGVKAGFEELWIAEEGAFETAAGGSGTALRMHGGGFTLKNGFSGWAEADLNKGAVSVEKGTLSFGIAEKDLEGLTDKSAVLALGAGTLAMNDASIKVGTTDAELGAGDLHFASDSALVFTTTNLDRKSPLVSSDGSLTVEKGSELVLAGASIGRHYLGDKLDVSGIEEGAWTGEDFVNKTAHDVTFGRDENGVYMVVGTEDVRETAMNVAAVNIVNAVLSGENRAVDSEDAGIAFISRVLDDVYSGTTDMAEKGAMLNNAMLIGAGSGADAFALDAVEQAADAIDSRLSLQTPYRDLTGLPTDGALWAQVTGGKFKADDLGAPAGMKAGYDADVYGLMAGGDARIGGGWTLGGAFGYREGDLKSEGDFSKISTDVESWGLYAYGAKRVGNLNFTAQLGWTQFSSDAESSLPASLGMGKVEASPDAAVISAGFGVEWRTEGNAYSIVPHAGLRWLHADFDGYDVEINGASAFEVAGEKASVFQIPVGVSGALKMRAGKWSVRPFADVTVVGTFGDTDRAYDLSSRALGASDSMSYDIAGDVVGKFTFGIDAHRKSFDMGLKYTGAAGDAGKQSHSFSGELKWHF